MSNTTYFGKDARERLKAGIDIVHDAVSKTLGANGRNVVFNKWTRVPIITNDGVSIAREIEPENLSLRQGANLIKQVAEQTNDEAGDGTSTSIILAHSIITSGFQLIEKETVNPMKLRKEISEATKMVVTKLKEVAKPVTSLEDLEKVATVSVESPDIGKTIAKAIYDAGDTGIVYVNESSDIGVSIEKIEGYQFQQGMITPYLFTNPERMETVLENCAVFLTDIQLTLSNEFLKMMEKIIAETKDILIICDEFHPDLLKFAVKNLAKGNFTMAIVKKPMNSDFLEDAAMLVGAEALTANKGVVFPRIDYVGRCKKVVVTKNTTTIFEGVNAEKTTEYVENLKKQIDVAKEAHDEVQVTKLEERIARLTSGVYMLNVGDKTEAEMRYLKLKVEDAVNATKAAKAEGIVTGGGVALYWIAQELTGETWGEMIIRKACEAPLKQLVENSGEDFNDIKGKLDVGMGFDALTGKVSKLEDQGIYDPVKVTRTALENASTFSGLLLTTETLITPNSEPEDRPTR